MAGFIAALGWALRGWLPPKWALLGTLLVVFRIGLVSYWVNSYFGWRTCRGRSELLRYFEGRSVWTAEVGKTGVTLKQGYAGL
jgi:hypothetical protein